MVARTYEFYVRAARTISHSWDSAVMIQVWVHSEQQQSSLHLLENRNKLREYWLPGITDS